MAYKNITLQSEHNITLITVNRPDKLNALNIETIDELHHAFLETENDKNTNVIILTGSGSKAFVAGADISEFYKFTVEQGKQLSADGHDKLFNLIENLTKPVIAAVNGFALGGGLELAMSCHIRVASDNAKMGLPEVSLGVTPGYGGTQRLPQLVGKGKAMEMIFTAQMITVQDALNYKLVNYVTAPDELINKCKEIAAQICKNSPTAISAAIRSINAGYMGNNGLNTEITEFGKCFGTADFKEGTAAFVEKRKPRFTGC